MANKVVVITFNLIQVMIANIYYMKNHYHNQMLQAIQTISVFLTFGTNSAIIWLNFSKQRKCVWGVGVCVCTVLKIKSHLNVHNLL